MYYSSRNWDGEHNRRSVVADLAVVEWLRGTVIVALVGGRALLVLLLELLELGLRDRERVVDDPPVYNLRARRRREASAVVEQVTTCYLRVQQVYVIEPTDPQRVRRALYIQKLT